MPYNSRGDVVRLWVERYDTKFNVNLGRFRSQLQASEVSSPHLRVVIQRNSLSVDDNIYIYIYIVIHRQTVSFYQNSSVWLDSQDARSRDRNPSNFTID